MAAFLIQRPPAYPDSSPLPLPPPSPPSYQVDSMHEKEAIWWDMHFLHMHIHVIHEGRRLFHCYMRRGTPCEE